MSFEKPTDYSEMPGPSMSENGTPCRPQAGDEAVKLSLFALFVFHSGVNLYLFLYLQNLLLKIFFCSNI